jgi:hypothetical protein
VSFPGCSRTLLLAVVTLCLGLAGCAPAGDAGYTPSAAAASGGFAEKWLNDYLRGLDHAAAGKFSLAAADFREASRGDDFDRRISLGPRGKIMHYFPHRELGILLYRQKEYTRAIDELFYSIESEPTARAHYFLDLARAAKVEREGSDRTPPLVTLQQSTAVEATNALAKRIRGVARDDTFIAAVTVAGRRISLEPARSSYVFEEDVALEEGTNTIEVTATDLAGQQGFQVLEVYGDRLGPLVELSAINTEDGMAAVSGNVSDAGGLRSLTINGHPWPITGHFEAYNFRFAQLPGIMTIAAADRAGNLTTVFMDTSEPGIAAAQDSPAPEAPQGDDPGNGSRGRDQEKSRSSDPEPEAGGAPPAISLEGMYDGAETYDESASFLVRLDDTDGFHSIFVNAAPVLPKFGKTVFFTVRKKLRPGMNEIRISAFDRHGNKAVRKITVTRKVPAIRQEVSRMRLGVLPFAPRDNESHLAAETGSKIAACLRKERRFQAEYFTAGLPEGADTHAERTAPPPPPGPEQIPPGAFDAMLSGTVHVAAGYAEVVARVTDTRTSRVMAVDDVFGPVASPDGMENLACALAGKLAHAFPLVQGLVTGVEGGSATINLGKRDGIKPYSRFIVFRPSPPFAHPVTGAVIHSEPDFVGIVQVTEVDEESATCEIIDAGERVRPHDLVIAR